MTAAPHVAGQRFLVWGAGGHGRVVAEIILSAGGKVVGFLDRRPPVEEEHSNRLPEVVEILDEGLFITGLREQRSYPVGVEAVALGIGDNQVRRRCLYELEGHSLPAVVHATAFVSPSANLGRGVTVGANASINAGAVVGDGTIVNTGAIVEHDCELGECTHVSPGAVLGGGVRLGAGAWVGMGASVLPRVGIGSGAIVGAGAVVNRDVSSGVRVAGVPARQL